jgi:hypothetical protein
VEQIEMNKRLAVLLGGVAAVATLDAAQASTALTLAPISSIPVQSYAELLDPIPNASTLLVADDAAREQQRSARVQMAQYHHHHHHHHSHHFGLGFGYVPRPCYGGVEYCYWTFGRPYWNGYRWVRSRVRVCD